MAEHTEIVTIASMRRLTNTTNGGPRYRITASDGRTFVTRPDCAESYGWTERFIAHPAVITTDSRGRIFAIEPAGPTAAARAYCELCAREVEFIGNGTWQDRDGDARCIGGLTRHRPDPLKGSSSAGQATI